MRACVDFRRLLVGAAVSCALLIGLSSRFAAADETQPKDAAPSVDAKNSEVAEGESPMGRPSSSGSSSGSSAAKSKYRPYADVLKDADTKSGLIKMHRKGGTLYGELSPSQLNRDFIIVISIAKGIGREPLYGGMSWGFGDDWVWQFRKVDDYIHVVRRNVRFSAAKGSPEEKAVKLAYTDSVLFSLPIVSVGPGGGIVVDLNPVFMSDLPQIARTLPGFGFSPQRSTYADVKALDDNVEVQVAATYASSGNADIDSVADSRGATINVHYSISNLPQTGYRPRLADDRVGYFLTVVKDYSKKTDEERFIRYINRWDLQKADSSADLSPPKKPVIFWLEKTIPYKYRAPIRDGILEWNKAFEEAGFVNAIEVRQQPDSADWDPEDINYNTFRWITASAKFAMGPSRVNPTTGQILDADIIFDADFVQIWDDEFERFTPESIAALTGGPLDLESYRRQQQRLAPHEHGFCAECQLATGRSLDFAMGMTAMLAGDKAKTDAQREKMVMQGLKEVAMHEVGHTLGLRHNFKASTYMSLDEMTDTDKTKETGLAASVMDYLPAYIAPKGKEQGDYFSTTIGPYDIWAIEYGYTPVSASSPEAERGALNKIATRSGEAALQFATDEDTRGIDSDPHTNRYDMGKDAIEYAKFRAEMIAELWPSVVDRLVKDGDGYERARQGFGVLLTQYGRAMHFASRYIGGVELNRSHKGDKDGRPPFEVVPADKQREALTLLEEQVFSDKPFQFPPKLYNFLASSRWNHWGARTPTRRDYPVHEVISMWQSRILDQLLSSLTLTRLHDSEIKIPEDEDAFTTAELISGLTKAIFIEVDEMEDGEYTNRKPAISSMRRNLQRIYLGKLGELAMGRTSAPEDCSTLAYMQLKSLQDRINKRLESKVKFDDYSRAHLTETAARIGKILDSHMELQLSGGGFGGSGFLSFHAE